MDRRAHPRIQGGALVCYRTINPVEMEHLLLRLQRRTPENISNSDMLISDGELRGQITKLAEREPMVAQILNVLEQRLHRLAQHSFLHGCAQADHPITNVDVSAAGVGFDQRLSLDIGIYIELEILLIPYMASIPTIARVIRCETEQSPDKEGLYRIAMDFDFINEEEQSLLMRHVLQEH